MTCFPVLPLRFDVAPLLSQIEANPELWNEIDLRTAKPGSPHAGTSDIWVRYNDIRPYLRRGSMIGLNDPHVPIWYPAWQKLPALRPIVFKLMAKLEGEMLGAVLITRIPAGGKIKPHVDPGWHVEYFQKFYIALKSPVGADLVCERDGDVESINPKVGSVHYFDNRKLHWVVNDSAEERMTLIVCIRTDKYR